MYNQQARSGGAKYGPFRLIVYAIALFAWIVLGLIMSRNLQIILSSYIESMTNIFQVAEYFFNAVIIVAVPIFIRYGLGKGTVKGILQGELDDIGINKHPRLFDLFWGVIGLVATLVLSSWALFVVNNQFTWLGLNQTLVSESLTQVNPFQLIQLFVVIVIIAPIAEELIFRGWMYGKLRKISNGGIWGAVLPIILVSLFFGISHGQVTVGVVTAIMGVILCIMREYTGTIWAGVVTHALKNLVAFIIIIY